MSEGVRRNFGTSPREWRSHGAHPTGSQDHQPGMRAGRSRTHVAPHLEAPDFDGVRTWKNSRVEHGSTTGLWRVQLVQQPPEEA